MGIALRQPASRQLGEAGQNRARLFFEEEFGWGPVDTGAHDLGTDLFVQLRNRQLDDLGLMIGVQVKRGASYFSRPKHRDGRSGWWICGSGQHAEYWLNHHIPHILVLISGDGEMWWVPLDHEHLEHTSSGEVGVFVPAESRLDKASAGPLLQLAAQARREAPGLQGASWSFRLEQLPASDWARYALLAPRLVAPHRNRSVADHGALRWPGAAALCLRADVGHWRRFADEQPAIPSPSQAREHGDPGWRFAGRLYAWLAEGTWTPGKPGENYASDLVAANSVCAALASLDAGDPQTSIDICEAALANTLPAADHGWLQTIRARLLREAGDDAAALDAFRAADESLDGITRHDPTVDLLRSAALTGLFNADPLGVDVDLPRLIRAWDTAPNWWRGQQVAGGLERLTDQLFDPWSERLVVHLARDTTARRGLFSAWTIARLGGAWEDARSALSRLGMADLMLGVADPVDGLSELRASGAHRQLVAAVERFRRHGPLSAVLELVREVKPAMLRSTVACDMALLATAGNYCTDEQAPALVDRLIEEVVTPTWLSARRGPITATQVIRALSGLADFVTTEQADMLAEYLLTLTSVGGAELGDWLRLATRLQPSDRTSDKAAVRVEQLGAEEPLAMPLARLAADSGGTRLRLAHRLLLDGNLDGLDLLQAWDEMHAEAVAPVLIALRRGIDRSRGVRKPDGKVTYPSGGRDELLTLTELVLFHPSAGEEGGWSTLLPTIADGTVFVELKRAALLRLTHFSSRVPPALRKSVHTALSTALSLPKRESPFPPGFEQPIGGALDVAWLEFHPDGVSAAPEVVFRLLAREDARADCASYLGLHPGWESVLAALLSDEDWRVRMNAAESLAIRLARTTSPGPDWSVPLLAAVDRGGETIPAAIIRGLSHPDPVHPSPVGVVVLLDALASHPSRAVRIAAARLLGCTS